MFFVCSTSTRKQRYCLISLRVFLEQSEVKILRSVPRPLLLPVLHGALGPRNNKFLLVSVNRVTVNFRELFQYLVNFLPALLFKISYINFNILSSLRVRVEYFYLKSCMRWHVYR